MKYGVFLIVALFVGCSTTRADEVGSEALQIVRAAGFTKIRDVEVGDVRSPIGRQQSGATMAALGTGTAAGVFSPPPGVSRSLGSGLLLAGSVLTSLPVGHPENSPRLLVWMPKALAESPQSASEVLRSIYLEAVQKALPSYLVELGERPKQKKSPLRKFVALQGEICVTPCHMFGFFLEDGHEPKLDQAPSILGAYDAYAWGTPGVRGDGNIAGFPWSVAIAPSERIDFFRRLSENLPDWVYLYLPPDDRIAPYPQLLHRGEVLLFVEPGLLAQASTDDPTQPSPEKESQ